MVIHFLEVVIQKKNKLEVVQQNKQCIKSNEFSILNTNCITHVSLMPVTKCKFIFRFLVHNEEKRKQIGLELLLS